MNTPNPTPRRIEWSGPDGWLVWADEDGVHVRAPQGQGLEMPEVERLFAIWQHARMATTTGCIEAPRPPTREEIREDGYRRSEERALRRAVRAVEAEFNPPADAPF